MKQHEKDVRHNHNESKIDDIKKHCINDCNHNKRNKISGFDRSCRQINNNKIRKECKAYQFKEYRASEISKGLNMQNRKERIQYNPYVKYQSAY